MSRNMLLKLCRQTALVLALSTASYSMAATPVDQVVAVVGDNAILQSDLEQAATIIKSQLQSQNQPIPSDDVIYKRVLDQLILREAQIEQVKRYGVQPTEQEVNAALLTYAQQQGFSSLQAFQQQVDQQQPDTYKLIREQMAEEVAINTLRQQMVMSRIKISDRDVKNFLQSPQGQAALGTEVHLISFEIKPEANTNKADIEKITQQLRSGLIDNNATPATLAKKYSTPQINITASDMNFVPLAELPADIAARVSGLQKGQTTELIPTQNGIYIFKLLDRRASEKKFMVTQYQTQHILIQPSEVVSPEDAQQKIQQIYQRLKQGADFTEMASTYSTDPGSASDGGSLGWVPPGAMVPEFEKVMTETPQGQISQPFQTPYGWHILKVNGIRQTDMTEEYQRRAARQILAESRFDAELENWLRELRNSTYIDIKDPALKN